MRKEIFPALLAGLLLIGGCALQPAAKPVEVLDERTGITTAALNEPIELLPNSPLPGLGSGKRSTFAYLGPVEWDRMGTITYGLWVHIAPGTDRQPGDLRAPGNAVLSLDGGDIVLKLMDAPKLGRAPYRDAVSWGQTAYFELTVAALRQIAASRKLELTVPGAEGDPLIFTSSGDSHPPLSRYLQARGITGD